MSKYEKHMSYRNDRNNKFRSHNEGKSDSENKAQNHPCTNCDHENERPKEIKTQQNSPCHIRQILGHWASECPLKDEMKIESETKIETNVADKA